MSVSGNIPAALFQDKGTVMKKTAKKKFSGLQFGKKQTKLYCCHENQPSAERTE